MAGDDVADKKAQLLDPFAYFRDLSIHPGAAPAGEKGAGELQVSARRGGQLVATAAATVLDGCADVHLSADVALLGHGGGDEPCDAALLAFLTLCVQAEARDRCAASAARLAPASFTEMCSGSEAGSCLQELPGGTREALSLLGCSPSPKSQTPKP